MKEQFIPPERAKELDKILGLPSSDKAKKSAREKIRVEGRPDPHADVTDPKLKKLLDKAMKDFDPRQY